VVLNVLPVRLRSSLSLGFAKRTISVGQIFVDIASLVGCNNYAG